MSTSASFSTSSAKIRAERKTVKKLNILVVDYSSVMRRLVERSLRQAGVELGSIHEASDGYEALTIARQFRLDLTFCDINVAQGMDILEFLHQFKLTENVRGVPVLVITSAAGEYRVPATLAGGARGYVRKPLNPEQVREQVELLFK